MTVGDAYAYFDHLHFSSAKQKIADKILKEICDRLKLQLMSV